MKRIQFTAGGSHPLLLLVRDYLIRQGYALVPWDDVDDRLPVFSLYGSTFVPAQASLRDWPTLLLSSSGVYSDRDHLLQQREIEPMDEAHGHVITSPLDPQVLQPLNALLTEHLFCQRPGCKTIVVRPFNVYGPSITHGVVHEFVQAARQGEPLKVFSPGRQVRTFLYEEDFLSCIGLLVQRLLSGRRGIYNVGSDEQVEILSLAKSVGHAFCTVGEIELVENQPRHAWWRVPALERIRADTKWRATVSLRNGLFRLAREEGKQWV